MQPLFSYVTFGIIFFLKVRSMYGQKQVDSNISQVTIKGKGKNTVIKHKIRLAGKIFSISIAKINVLFFREVFAGAILLSRDGHLSR